MWIPIKDPYNKVYKAYLMVNVEDSCVTGGNNEKLTHGYSNILGVWETLSCYLCYQWEISRSTLIKYSRRVHGENIKMCFSAGSHGLFTLMGLGMILCIVKFYYSLGVLVLELLTKRS